MANPTTLKQPLIAALDIGTTKIVCFIARTNDSGALEIVGIGHQLARGIKSGAITDIAEAETSIVAAVHAAEQMVGQTIEEVVVSIGGAGVRTRTVAVELDILGEAVTDQDIADLIREGCSSLDAQDEEILHCFPTQYVLDGNRTIRDPRGMIGKTLGSELQIITVRRSFMRNLTHCLARCHLNISEFVSAQHASALAVLEQDEMDLGVTLIDMGGGMTSFSVFVGGKNIYSDAIMIGGNHVTNDVAQGLSTSLSCAERLKILHGNAVNSVKDAEVMIDVPQLGEREAEDEPTTMPRSMLIGVVRPRMEEIFELIRDRLEIAGMDKIAGRRCVLTGGASQMLGVADLAGRMLAKQVRKGKPMPVPGLADATSGPAFSTVVGMLEYATKRPWEEEILLREPMRLGWLTRLKQWFRENF
jgi:cell division protein FtsA